ncbi:MAG TPA: CocE/NonD family hydrolase [Caulobacteraceae bacterium]|nr:CocE/NonD family hydrolase [Caulobacteraceae bacterium]
MSEAAEPWPLPEKGAFDVVEHVWIPMADGLRLSARLWMPKDRGPVPAVLEYIPYRKRDYYRAVDDYWGEMLASHGFAFARVDVRGSGESEGALTDEYSEAELADGCAAIAWLAAQPWSNGAVGMRGISWGGINTLMIAARRPPALKAIMPMGCLDNRYTDDAHYIGGALGNPNQQWAMSFKMVLAAPPDPASAGDAWEAMWRERLAATPAIDELWVRHQRYDDYWKRGSICEDWGAIAVPTYVVAGWRDTYSNPVGRMLANLRVPTKALIGPWGHTFPYQAGLLWQHEELRWWAEWLTGEDTGIMAEPAVRGFMPYTAASEPGVVEGRWIAEAAWPPVTQAVTLHLGEGGLAGAPQPTAVATIRGDRIVGLCKPEWLNRPPLEQSFDDARSLTFDSEPIEEAIEILGVPLVRLRLASDQPVAHIAARVTEVLPEGRSELVSWGLLNLTHRDSHTTPEALVPGEVYDIELALASVAHRFPASSRIRLALSESLWPLVWPSPRPATLTVALEHCSVTLPVRPREAADAPFTIPERRRTAAPPKARAAPAPPDADGWARLAMDTAPHTTRIEAIDLEVTLSRTERLEMREGDPGSCRWRQGARQTWTRGDWACTVETACELTATTTHLRVSESLIALKGETVVFERNTTAEIERDLM